MAGKPYRSYNESEVKDYRDGSVKATLSQVNAGIFAEIFVKLVVPAKP